MVTHDPVAAAHADSVLFLADGRFVGRLDRPTADAVAERMAHLGDAATTAAGTAHAAGRPAAEVA
jgi:putative ABC transport system ATP-binding protein